MIGGSGFVGLYADNTYSYSGYSTRKQETNGPMESFAKSLGKYFEKVTD